jgi:cell division protein FtsI/penicillin-binding protein 2
MRKSRVLMLAAGLLLGLVGLWLRIGWLQVFCHHHYAERAERNQEQRVLVPPVRGNLLDRHGRPLARDLLTCSISAAPGEMPAPAAAARDLARVLRLDPAHLAREFAARPRFLWVARRVSPALGEEIADRKMRGVYVSIERRRDYVLGAAASELLGRTNVDNEGIEGLELELNDELRGHAGWTTLFRVGRSRTVSLARSLRRSPEDGFSAVLTLDADLQSILEAHLARAVDTLHAVRACGLFLDPRTGEILAAANVPHLADGRARNWNFTDQFEPGSTFKIVVAGASLEEGVAMPGTWIEASATGQAVLAGGAIIHDVHKAPGYRFADAVRWSSNIAMGRLGMMLGAERLYRYASDLGFGGLTGVAFPGEACGKLRSPTHWSGRSCPTIAIGHELSVTPLQLALAYATVANGGVLMNPMLVREIRDAEGHVVRQFQPHAAHRVFSAHTTRMLGAMLAMVVDSGTAKAARVPGLRIAGKTGTAQKYDPRLKTYAVGKYVSSFAGYAPADDPRLVGVIVIDESHSRFYYGGEVAAPVFREVMVDLRGLPRGPFDPGVEQIAARPPSPAPVQVPDLRLLPPHSADRRLAECGLRLHLQGSGPRVLAQDPAAGSAVERGAGVTAWLSAPEDSIDRMLPDLTGVPLREALRRLARLEVRARIHGQGQVVSQQPAPGTALPLAGDCDLWCQSGAAVAAPGRAGADERRLTATAVAWRRTAPR